MKKSLFVIIICIIIIFLVSCGAPSQQAIQTAIVQTQTANPSSTLTPVPPTQTETETQTITSKLSPTPDLLLLQDNLKDFLLQKSEIPFIDFSSIFQSPQAIPNEKETLSFVEKTGRIDGWHVLYGQGYGAPWDITISDEISLYKTTDGSHLAITMYPLNGYIEEINQPIIGDSSRSFYKELPKQNGYKYGIYTIIFSYRNFVHVVEGVGYIDASAGYESLGLKEYIRNIAQNLLAKLQSSSFLNQ
jgi:hypothetical protein